MRAYMNCLVTGAEGFLGSHLVEFLLSQGVVVTGVVFGATDRLIGIEGKIRVVSCDLRDAERTTQVVANTRPDVIYHLAAQSYPTVSWAQPAETLRTNAIGTLHLLEAARQLPAAPLVVLVSSSAVYGYTEERENPIKESQPFRPTNVYAVSKVAEEMLGLSHWRAYGLPVVIVRPFNMTGPRKTGDACSDFARGAVEIERGVREVLEVGNLDTVRDIIDGRDAVRALWQVATLGSIGEAYNLCSGQGWRMRQILKLFLSIAGQRELWRQVTDRHRPYDEAIYIGDNARLRALGWEPMISIEQTLRDLLDYWRSALP